MHATTQNISVSRKYLCMSTKISLVCFVHIIKRIMLSNIISAGPNEDEAQACLRALFLTDPRDDRGKLISTRGSRVDGTCKWIKTNALYDSWLRSHPRLLWLSGGPAKGKTMLSIFLAEELEQIARLSPNTLFLQYFCDNKDERRNTAVTIIRGLIYQLLQSPHELFGHILPCFKIQRESLFVNSSFETLWGIFESMVCDPVLGTTYCVLDGLDECDEASLKVLLEKFAALLSAKTRESLACHLKLIVVCRDFPDFIPELLSSFPRIRLDPDADTEINNDIHLFIKAKVEELSRYRLYPETLRVHVEEVFRDRAQGTFLWIGIVAKALKKYKATEVEKALDLFPPGLDELYARILLQIDSGRREIAARILRWVVMAVRPLTLSELSIAIETTVRSSVAAFDRDEMTRDQVSCCGYFLTIGADEVGLIHQSAKDYLLRKTCDSNPELEAFRVKEEVANLEIAKKCLNYLENGALAKRESETLKQRQFSPLRDPSHLKAFPLLSYAALHWHEHARFLSCSEDIFDLSRPFYHKKTQICMSWFKAYWIMRVSDYPPSSFTQLHLASYFGIPPLVENLVLTKQWIDRMKRFYYLNKSDSRRWTALMWAAYGDHETVVRILLKKRAAIEARDETRETALMKAASCRSEAVVRLLLEKGADIEAKTINDQTALSLAASRGHEAVVQLLLEKGADIEARTYRSRTALTEAAAGGHEAVVRLLLEKGADTDARDEFGETALMEAASGGHEAVVQLLLEKGADIEAKAKHCLVQTALMMAAGGGHEAVVQLLLEKGADIAVKDIYEGTALSYAVQEEHEAVVQLLTPVNLNS